MTSLVGIILVIVFFVTSSDSGSLAVGIPGNLAGAGGIALLLVGGRLVAAQAMSLTNALPFTFVLLGACYDVVRGLMEEVH